MKRFLYFLVLGLLLVALGIYVWAEPNSFMNVLALVLSLYLIFDGLKTFFLLYKVSKKEKSVDVSAIEKRVSKSVKITMIVKGALNLLIGLIAIIVVSTSKTAALKVMMYIIASDFIISAIIDFIEYFSLKSNGFDSPTMLVEGSFGLLLGIIFCIFPEVIGEAALRILSVIVIVIGVVSICQAIYSLVLVHELKKHGIVFTPNKDKSKKEADAEFEEIKETDDNSK